MPNRRLLLVALDAMEVTWLRRLAAQGRLPNLAAFFGETLELPVRSDGDSLHGSIWPTFASGLGPGQHGRYWWLQWLPEEMRFARSSHPAFDYRPFWLGLAEAGQRVTVIDVPYAPLARHALVEQISGWGVHDEVEPESWPDDALPQLRRAWGAHPLSFDTVEPHSPRDLVRMARTLKEGVELRARLLEQLAGERERDFVMVLFGETHKAGHYLAEEREVVPGATNFDLIAEVLQPLDEAWPRVLAAAGEGTTVALFALHGIQHQVDYSVLGRQVLAIALGRDPASALPRPDLLRRVRDLVPDPVHRFVWQRLPAGIRAARQGALDSSGAHPGAEPVFRVGHDGDFAARVSIAGREAEGVVNREDADAWLARLEEAALPFRSPEGLPVFSGLLRLAERFPGPRADYLPDGLLVSNRELTRVLEAVDPAGRRIVNPMAERRNGIHAGRGFCFIRPAAVVSLQPAGEVDARDFAPTSYALLGLAPPDGFEGRAFAPVL
ncbi:MAG: alkaline phosphatase family protein [Dehalococcoidia bacterium]|nr:alkaline phosphatase family protein [Dehalococcoidia bacterium]